MEKIRKWIKINKKYEIVVPYFLSKETVMKHDIIEVYKGVMDLDFNLVDRFIFSFALLIIFKIENV
jgi:hypothetical protein